jgi:hypothetical protein
MKWTLLPLLFLAIIVLFAFAIMGTVLTAIGSIVLALLGAIFAIIGVFLKLIFTPLIGLVFLAALIWFLVYRRRDTVKS